MEWFYFITIAIAIILLIIVLIFIGSRMVGNKKGGNTDTEYPPITNTCPDLWESYMDDDNKVWCKVPAFGTSNIGSIRSSTNASIVQSDKYPLIVKENKDGTVNNDWADIQDNEIPICSKKGWANMNNIAWDGISNYNQCD
tara:strand:+ start:517 stop:939 length:423 start_codon:yes stop_codon:yes gene_type:complete